MAPGSFSDICLAFDLALVRNGGFLKENEMLVEVLAGFEVWSRPLNRYSRMRWM